MFNLIGLVVLAILIESVWESLKMIWQEGKLQIDKLGALAVSLIICFSVRIDILALLEINSTIPFLGICLTAILLSRGSNFVHDLLEKLAKSKNNE